MNNDIINSKSRGGILDFINSVIRDFLADPLNFIVKLFRDLISDSWDFIVWFFRDLLSGPVYIIIVIISVIGIFGCVLYILRTIQKKKEALLQYQQSILQSSTEATANQNNNAVDNYSIYGANPINNSSTMNSEGMMNNYSNYVDGIVPGDNRNSNTSEQK